MRTDSLIANTEDIGDSVWEFHGTPIRQWNPLDAEIRELSDAQQRVRYFLGSESAPIEVLPGEVIKDNLIRRETTAEVVGEKFYDAEIPAGSKIWLDGGIEQFDKLTTWRPGNQDFAIVHEE